MRSAAYAVADRSIGTPLATGAFVATFLSAITVIGVSGYASRYGWSAAALTCYGYALGWILLVVAAKKMHRSGLTTVPEFLRTRYESIGLGVFSAVAIISLYSITLIVQLLGVAITLNMLIGFAMPLAILLVGVIFVTYTVLGGLTSVIRTDMIQAVLLGGGVLVGATVVLWKTDFAVIHAPPEPLSHFFGGNVSNASDLISWALVWGLGIPTQSYYLHRFYASRDTNVARMQIALGSLVIMVLLLSVIICGVGAGMLIPPDQVGDGAFPYLFKNVIGGWVSVFILLAVTASVHSTTDGLLHVVGLYFAVDVYKSARNEASKAQLLRVSRQATLVFGIDGHAARGLRLLEPGSADQLDRRYRVGRHGVDVVRATVLRTVLAEGHACRRDRELDGGVDVCGGRFLPEAVGCVCISRDLSGNYRFFRVDGCGLLGHAAEHGASHQPVLRSERRNRLGVHKRRQTGLRIRLSCCSWPSAGS